MLLEKALEGAKSQGAIIKLIHLYDLNYKGFIRCFACKAKGGRVMENSSSLMIFSQFSKRLRTLTLSFSALLFIWEMLQERCAHFWSG